MSSDASYILTLRSKDRRLLITLIAFFSVGGLLFAWQAAVSRNPLILVFFLVWVGVAVRNFYKFLGGPTEIEVLQNGQVRLVNWFKREYNIAMEDIKEIELRANVLWIKTPERDHISFSGFDGLHRFVHDVARHNTQLITKGI